VRSLWILSRYLSFLSLTVCLRAQGNFQNVPDEFDENKRTKAPLVVLASPCGGVATVFDSPMKLAG